MQAGSRGGAGPAPGTQKQAKPRGAAGQVAARPTKKQPESAAAKRPAPGKPGQRADFGQPVDGFFATQPAPLRPILAALRELIEEALPDADSSIKWGMPFYSSNGRMICAIGAHKAHVNLILAGPPGAFADPEGRLEGAGKVGRHLKLTSLDELPRTEVRGWLRTAAALAAKGS